MSALVVYETSFGNTESVARAIADGIAQHMPVRVVSVADPEAAEPVDESLVVVGGPTHAFGMSRASTRRDAQGRLDVMPHDVPGIRDWIAGLPPDPTDRLYATFDTRAKTVQHLPGSAARAAARALHRSGHHALGHPESFYVTDVEGPLVPDELDRARDWGAAIAQAADEAGART
ncbi:flavodoxin-like protein [Isoptericola jiangsuensis]|uniref:Flavodoxin-like protein n=1 Tax=Isoptericola jiangsuensis TaxID=548579 RepID=A0A2A9EYF8_9MICO|nr:flavodoxin family protein [Isoptericola jiangsuensis]PFG43561.1 flavodoxin-like protein [Isoptericola jiangsuensis]